MMDTQEGAQQGRKQLGCRQKSALGSEFGWIPARAPPCPPPPPRDSEPFLRFVPTWSPFSLITTKGSSLSCACAGSRGCSKRERDGVELCGDGSVETDGAEVV